MKMDVIQLFSERAQCRVQVGRCGLGGGVVVRQSTKIRASATESTYENQMAANLSLAANTYEYDWEYV